MARIRVMVVDDEDGLRRGVSLYLESLEHFELVAEAASGIEAVQLCDETLPDVILMDIRMPGMDGIAAAKSIHTKHPRMQIIAFASIYEENVIQQMRDAGALCYVMKDAPVDDLLKAIISAGKASGVNVLN